MSSPFILKTWLEINGKTIPDLAKAAGISVLRARRLARGAWPTAREACAIRDLTGLSIDHWVPKVPPEF